MALLALALVGGASLLGWTLYQTETALAEATEGVTEQRKRANG
jgi:hypothetical protein